jgi:small redox-active disulfide protein 2
MGLFGKKDKNIEATSIGIIGGDGVPKVEVAAAKEGAEKASGSVKILGSGCSKCSQLEKSTIEALNELGMEVDVDHITDFSEIAAYGVMTTPALVVDDKVVSYGKTLKKNELVKILQEVRG